MHFYSFWKILIPLFCFDLILNEQAIIFPQNMFIDSKIFHHFDDGVVDDFTRVDSDREVHVRTAGIVEQLEMENIG